MMISEKMAAQLNEQVGNEFFAFWTYQAMAYAFEDMGHTGFAGWFYGQAKEEATHAEKIARYLLDQGAVVKLEAMPKPKTDYKSVKEIVEGAKAHEIMVTKQINALVDTANSENDHASRQFLDWFVAEQVEEVSSVQDLLDKVNMCETTGQLFMLERGLTRSEG